MKPENQLRPEDTRWLWVIVITLAVLSFALGIWHGAVFSSGSLLSLGLIFLALAGMRPTQRGPGYWSLLGISIMLTLLGLAVQLRA